MKRLAIVLIFLPALAFAEKGDGMAPEKMSAPAGHAAGSKAAPSTEKRVLPGLKK